MTPTYLHMPHRLLRGGAASIMRRGPCRSLGGASSVPAWVSFSSHRESESHWGITFRTLVVGNVGATFNYATEVETRPVRTLST